jgi:alkanesulfonate monooxygenase SsuD/methylene tetrahydromethanopterin reductase-like flavin-dependent oxidoreductase (luciferase family)
MSVNIKTRPSAFEEALDIVRRLLAGETVSSARRFRIAEASLALRPAEPVEVWIGASAPPAIDRAARLAEGWIARPSLTPEDARAQADMYRDRCAAYGKQTGASATARHLRRRVGGRGASGASARAGPRLSRHLAEALIAGSVDEVTEQFRGFGKIGYTEILVRHLTNDQAKVLAPLARLAAVRAALA